MPDPIAERLREIRSRLAAAFMDSGMYDENHACDDVAFLLDHLDSLGEVERQRDAVIVRVRELADNMVKHGDRWYRESTANFGRLLLDALAALDHPLSPETAE